ncbi:unnamed protein product [Lepeophtheirus salmonis]|uniref:(salmon louse) hypothetical protein n=1 Tax=Lepeophtheirus salmonis TaxID=72036 RepID=A0A7R8CTM6_LEPSM|nr:unnamed protein product [Lepeophtheirus salmonis]CAF2927546.1 unnamed protein product [Lepeophtheirus salmonis]
MKLSLFLRQAGSNRFCHFPLLKEAKILGELAANYQVQLDNLAIEVGRRFQNFKNLEPQLNMLGSPFTTYVDLATEDLQLELPDLQANNDLKEKFKSDSLPNFYKSLSDDLFSNFKNFAAKFLTLFGFTYICEQAFSCLKINRSKKQVFADRHQLG